MSSRDYQQCFTPKIVMYNNSYMIAVKDMHFSKKKKVQNIHGDGSITSLPLMSLSGFDSDHLSI